MIWAGSGKGNSIGDAKQLKEAPLNHTRFVFAFDIGLALPGHLRSQFRGREISLQCGRHRAGLQWRYEEAIDFIADDVGYAASGASHHRNST